MPKPEAKPRSVIIANQRINIRIILFNSIPVKVMFLFNEAINSGPNTQNNAPSTSNRNQPHFESILPETTIDYK